jgi:hypothetical protein
MRVRVFMLNTSCCCFKTRQFQELSLSITAAPHLGNKTRPCSPSPVPASFASSGAAPPLPHDDTSGTASVSYPDHTRRRLPPPAEYGPHPTATFVRLCCVCPTSRAPRPALPRGCASAPGTPSPYPPRTPRTHPCRADTPGRADIPDQTAAATRARSSPSKTFGAASPEPPTGTTGRAAVHAAPAAIPRASLFLPPPVCDPVPSPLQPKGLQPYSRAPTALSD